jgi:hypothetical protein
MPVRLASQTSWLEGQDNLLALTAVDIPELMPIEVIRFTSHAASDTSVCREAFSKGN